MYCNIDAILGQISGKIVVVFVQQKSNTLVLLFRVLKSTTFTAFQKATDLQNSRPGFSWLA